MAKAWRCNHHLVAKDTKPVCANCGKQVEWCSINNSKKIGFWFHWRTQMEECAPMVATPVDAGCYHDNGHTRNREWAEAGKS